MPRMIELIRESSVPANIMRLGAKGALSVSSDESIEILVHLALHNKPFGEQAQLTLAGWSEKDLQKVAGDPATTSEVLEYLIDSKNLRLPLLPALLANPTVSEASITALASSANAEQAEVLMKSERVLASPGVLAALKSNPKATSAHVDAIRKKLSGADLPAEPDAGNDEDVSLYLKEHADEVVAEEGKPFQPIGGVHEFEAGGEPAPVVAPAAGAEVSVASGGAAASTRKVAPPVERGSTLQKIASLGITGRIQLAMKGSKEERSLLIRDGTKIVALAVLQSPKISDGEVEKFATQKNVLEAVLRAIPMKRQFAKNYNIIRNLVANPRTPLDVSLGLMKNLLPADLKALSGNKEVAETIRKLALRQFKQKTENADKK